jgi:nucleotide-binding universal stress UspA family protein
MGWQRVLLPTDFSTAADKAAEVALTLVGPRGHVELVHIYNPPSLMLPDGSTFAATPEELLAATDRAEAALLAAKRGLLRYAGDVRIDTRALMGGAADEIVRLAESGDFDVVVMGTHGRSGLKRLLLGSVAESVLRRASIPVVTVRQSAEERRAHEPSALGEPPLP